MKAPPFANAQALPRLAPLRMLTGVAVLSACGMALGYARDASLAAVFGASAATDAFFVAAIIPTIAVAVLIAGALAPAALPVFGARLEQRAQAWRLANILLSWSALLLLFCVALVFFAAAGLVSWLAPGLDQETRALAIDLTRLGAPLLFLLGMSALLGAFANALGSFRLPALATLLVNGAAFAAILAFGRRMGISSAMWGLMAGAGLHLLAQLFGLYRQGWRPAFSLTWRNAELRETLRLLIPLIAFVALAQSVPIVERTMASSFPSGELSLLAYAGKLFQIPGIVVSSSLAVVLYPHLIQTRTHAPRAAKEWNDTLAQGARACIFLTLPLTLWFYFNANAIVRLLFERGAFSVADSATTAELARLYLLGVTPAGILLVWTRGLHARRKMNLALGLGALNTALYIAAAFVCAQRFGLRGLPIAFVAAQLFGCLLFAPFAFEPRGWRAVWHRSLGATGAANLALALGWFASGQLTQNFHGTALFALLSVSLLSGALLYLCLAGWWGSAEARDYIELGRARWKKFSASLLFGRE